MNIKGTLSKAKFEVKKASPAIMLAIGVGLSVASVIEFCRKSREGLPVIDEYKETVEELVDTHELAHDDETFVKDVFTETTKTGLKLGKIYAKPIVLYALSMASIGKGYSILHKRNVALVAAYAGIGNELRHVYSQLSEKYGPEVVDELKGIKKVEIEETRIDEKTGSEVVDKKLVPVVSGDPNWHSPYARFFDDSCAPIWRDDPEDNLTLLTEIEADCNQLLRRDGYLFLNDVYDKLGIPRSKAGQVVGWRYYRNGDNPSGDNFVSFGIHDVKRPEARDFVNGYESVFLIEPNVDGEIVDCLV